MESLKKSYAMTAASFRVLAQDARLLPHLYVAYGVATAVVAGLVLAGMGTELWTEGLDGTNLLMILAFYLFLSVGMMYLQVALVATLQSYLAGGGLAFSEGFSIASARRGPLVRWAVVAASVGWVLRYLEWAARRRTGYAGGVASRVTSSMFGSAWSIATFFAVPIIAAEGPNVRDALRRSSLVVRRRWGETIVSTVGIAPFMTVLALALAAVPFIAGLGLLAVGGTMGDVLGAVFLILAGFVLLFARITAGMLSAVYAGVLYRHATGGGSPMFPQEMVDEAFQSATVT